MRHDAVAIGTFDGVHVGHQSLLAAAQRSARAAGGRAIAYAFDVPPRAQTGQEDARLLLDPAMKRVILGGWVDRIVEASFPAVRDVSAESFVRDVLRRDLQARSVVVGASFRFGKDRSGDVATLVDLALDVDIDVVIVPPVLRDGVAVSSTRIRDLLLAGSVPEAASLLGRAPALRGAVVSGDAVGRTLGFPTANLALDPRVLLPLHGVYVAAAFVGGRRYPAMCYVGRRPTLAGTAVRCEVHLLESPTAELRGLVLETHVYRLLRPDRAFASLAQLQAQMEDDRRAALAASDACLEAMDPLPFGG